MRSKPLLRLVAAVLVWAPTLLLPGAADAAPKYKILHGFTGGKDGGGLWGSLTLDSKGDVYGATETTVFQLTPLPDGNWTLTILRGFHKAGPPNGGMALGPEGDLYGTTQACCPYGYGEVFRLSPGHGGWKETVIHHFGSRDHAGAPWDGPIMDKVGNLYGTAGSAYELSPGPSGWKFSNLHEFPSYKGDGSDPYAGLIMDASGNLYGTTAHGGGSDRCGGGCGTVYELSPQADSKWKETIVHSFQAYWDGSYPGLGALALDATGNMYGTADGGNSGYGVIFRMSLDSNGRWKETVLYNLAGGAEGDHPGAGVLMDKAGNLYGTTIAGGAYDSGVVYKLAPGKNGKWSYTVLHTFTYSDGAQPDANLILDDKGNLYGTAATGGPGGAGVAFELTP